MFAVITPDILTNIKVFNKYFINIMKIFIISDSSLYFFAI